MRMKKQHIVSLYMSNKSTRPSEISKIVRNVVNAIERLRPESQNVFCFLRGESGCIAFVRKILQKSSYFCLQ